MNKHYSNLHIKSLNEAQGTFEAYLSVFNVVDGQRDTVAPGAYSRCLRDLYARRQVKGTPYLIPLLWQHNPHEPIGGFTDMAEDSFGLRVSGEIDTDTELGRRAFSGLKRGYMGGLSIGYFTVKDEIRPDGVRVLKDIELFEGSCVTFPANELATVNPSSMKGTTTMGLRSLLNDMRAYGRRQGIAVPNPLTGVEARKAEENVIYRYQKYNSYEAAEMLGIAPALLHRWLAKAVHEGRSSAQERGTGYIMPGYEVADIANEHAIDIRGAWLQESKAVDTPFMLKDKMNNNYAFLALIPDGSDKDLKIGREASEQDYQNTPFKGIVRK